MSRRKNQGKHRADGPDWSATAQARALVDARDRTVEISAQHPMILEQTMLDLRRGLRVYAQTVARNGSAHPVADALEFTGRAHLIGQRLTEQVLREEAERTVAAGVAELEAADSFIVSPAMHATAVAAAYTLTDEEALSSFTLQDLPAQCGLLMLPQHMVVETPDGAVPQDFIAFSWSYNADAAPHQLNFHAWLDVHGPVQVGEFEAAAQLMAQNGMPMPPWLSLGTTGLPCPDEPLPTSERGHLDTSTRAMVAVNLADRTSDLAAGPQSLRADYDGESAISASSAMMWCCRYLLAFFRLTAQRTAVVEPFRAGVYPGMRHHRHHDTTVVTLRSYEPEPAGGDGESGRRYRSRFAVRMHKVNQWYPKEGVHRLIWRGPYMKGPADAPLRKNRPVTAIR